VRPVLIVVGLVAAQDPPQMGRVPDEGAVQELAAASADPAFGDCVHAGRPDVAEHGLDAGVGEDRVERGGEVRSAVANHELGPIGLFAEVREEVASLLGGPLSGGMQGDSEDADPPGACSITARTQAWVPSSRPAVKKSHARIASAWERKNCDHVGPVRRRAGLMPLALRISHTVDAATLTPSPASSP
jgi:hypothetical protein